MILTKFKLVCGSCGSDNCEVTADLFEDFGVETTSITVECNSCGVNEKQD